MGFGARTVENLRVKLNEAELVRKGEELARHHQETVALEEERAATVKMYAEQLKEKKLHHAKIANDMATQSEERPVEVFEEPRYSDHLVDVIRCDNKEIVRTRAMQPAERQMALRVVDNDNERYGDDGDETPGSTH